MNATIDERIAADGARATRYFAFGANMNKYFHISVNLLFIILYFNMHY